MKFSPPAWLRLGVVLLGAVAGVLLVRSMDEGFRREARPLDLGHAVMGLLLAAVVMPGPLLGFVVTPASSENARGLAAGGAAVTALVSVLGGALLIRRLDGAAGAVAFGWCALALPLSVLDFLRLRRSG